MKSDIKDFIYKLLKENKLKGLTDHGNSFRVQCPFHYPKKNFTSFSISYTREEKGFDYNCFGCGESGNIYTLLMHLHSVSFKKAESLFLKQVVISPITLDSLRKSFSDFTYKSSSYTEVIHPLINLPNKYNPEKMIEYLNWRNKFTAHNITDYDFIIKRYGLYYCNDGKFAERIIMPIKDLKGRIVYFTNRSIHHSCKQKNKFVFGSDASHFIYGLFEAVGKKKVMVTEGPFEVFQLRSFAKKNKINDYGFVAVMGTDMSQARATQLSECFEEAYILLDNEEDVLNDRWIKGKKVLGKEKKMYNVLSEYMKCFKITNQLYPGKEPSTSDEEQLQKIFDHKPQRRLTFEL